MFKLHSAQKHKRHQPPIPLLKEEKELLQRGEYHVYKLRTNPTVATSPTYELVVPYFGTGTCKEYLKFRDNFDKVCVGQNITAGLGKFTLSRHLLDSKALTEFELKVTELTEQNGTMTKTNKMVNQCLDAI